MKKVLWGCAFSGYKIGLPNFLVKAETQDMHLNRFKKWPLFHNAIKKNHYRPPTINLIPCFD